MSSSVTYSFAVGAVVKDYQNYVSSLREKTQEILIARHAWDVQTVNFSKGRYPEINALEHMMKREVDQYLSFQRAGQKTTEIYERFSRVIALCSRPPIEGKDHVTLESLGVNVQPVLRGEELRRFITPHLYTLLGRIEAVKKEFDTQLPIVAGHLNNALSHAYARLGKATVADAARNLVAKAYLERALHETAEAPPPTCNGEREETEKVTPEGEVAKLESLLEELQTLAEPEAPPRDPPPSTSFAVVAPDPEPTDLYAAFLGGEPSEDNLDLKDLKPVTTADVLQKLRQSPDTTI